MENVANIRYQVANHGTAAFPIWSVWKCYEDSEGYDLEHLSEQVFVTPSKQKALEFYSTLV